MKKQMLLVLTVLGVGYINALPKPDPYARMQCISANNNCGRGFAKKSQINKKDVQSVVNHIESLTGKKLSQNNVDQIGKIVTHPRPKNSRKRNSEMRPQCNSVTDCGCGCVAGCNETCAQVCQNCTTGGGEDYW